jgi:hypothetical protein
MNVTGWGLGLKENDPNHVLDNLLKSVGIFIQQWFPTTVTKSHISSIYMYVYKTEEF